MARLQEISSSDRLSQLVVQIMIQTRELIGQLEYYPHPGNADNPRKSSSADGGQYRSMNSDYPDNEVDPDFADLKLAILGDKVESDVAHERRAFDIASVRASDLRSFAKSLAKFYMHELIKGDGQSSAPIALNGLEGELPLSGSQAIYAEASDSTLTVQMGVSDTAVSSQQKLKRKLKELIELVEGEPILIMSGGLKSFLSSVFEGLFDRSEDQFGNDIEMFDGTPIFSPGKDPDGDPILAQDEQPGGITTNSQSVYCASFGEMEDVAQSTNIGVQVLDKSAVDSQYVYHVDLDTQQGVLNDEAAGRLAGIEVA